MIVKLEGGFEVECGDSQMAGREVGKMTYATGTVVPAEGEIWLVVNVDHGDHDTDYVCVFKDGFEMSRMRVDTPHLIELVWKRPIG
jgi:hypothetical protein